MNRALAATLLVLALTSCMPLAPYRTVDKVPAAECTADAQWQVPQGCGNATHEASKDYDLLFVEFTDQGLQFPSEEFGNAAAYQINNALGRLSQLADSSPGGLSVVVYVHGWKHNASSDDADVKNFRRLLRDASVVEAARTPQGSPARVVGLYVGWRGLSATVEPFRALSFWTRKTAASHVAEGSSRELLARLRGFRCQQNARFKAENCEASPPAENPKVRMVLIGHSFGALVLYNAISGAIIEAVLDNDVMQNAVRRPWSYGDMVVLLNPAFEATRYTPLHRMATGRGSAGAYKTYQSPILVAITTTQDWATRFVFPMGRFFSTLLARHASDEERIADMSTMGHMDLYVTHRLTVAAGAPGTCLGWEASRPEDQRSPEEEADAVRRNLVVEAGHSAATSPRGRALEAGWDRTFCGGAHLHHVAHDPHLPVWNIRADGEVMSSHGDISNVVLSSFLRQLYRESYP